jgi:hypothetical protein
MYSEFIPNLNSLNNDYARMFSPSIISPDNLINTREYSLQMSQINKFGLPKCGNQQNACRQIGVVGAGKFSFFYRIPPFDFE